MKSNKIRVPNWLTKMPVIDNNSQQLPTNCTRPNANFATRVLANSTSIQVGYQAAIISQTWPNAFIINYIDVFHIR